MMSKKFKKATLSISIGAIVVIVIAFVVLGLGLTLTKTIFGGAKEKIPGILSIGDIGTEPTSETPLTIEDHINVKRGKVKELKVGFYNKEVDTASNVSINLKGCQGVGEGLEVNEDNKPTVTSIKQDVKGSEAVAYKIFIKENGLNAGNYICRAVAENLEKEFESVQISLYITT